MNRYKDCNDCLKAGVPAEVMRSCLDQARDFAPEKVKNAAEFEAAFLSEWFDHELERGIPLPFADYFRIRPGELTVWTGIEKSGKSTLLSYVMTGLMDQGERGLVASLEVKAARTLHKMSRQAWGDYLVPKKNDGEAHTEEQRAAWRVNAREALTWLARNLWLYDHVGILHWRTLIDDITWAVRRHGIKQVVIDNFMRLGILKDDYAQQAEAIQALTQLAMDLGIHIHVVVHQNKTEAKGKGGMDSRGKRTVSGAFEIIANAHNIVEVMRDMVKGENVGDVHSDYAAHKINLEERDKKLKALGDDPDGKFVLHAQRDGETQNGSTALWFLYKSQQYVKVPPGTSEHGAIAFVAEARKKAPNRDFAEWPGELPSNEEMGLVTLQ